MASLTKPNTEEFTLFEVESLIAQAGALEATVLSLQDNGDGTHTYSATSTKPSAPREVTPTEPESINQPQE